MTVIIEHILPPWKTDLGFIEIKLLKSKWPKFSFVSPDFILLNFVENIIHHIAYPSGAHA